MTFAFRLRQVFIYTIIFAMLLTNVSVAEQRKTTDDSHIRSEAYGDVAFSSLVIISVVSLGRWLTPLDECGGRDSQTHGGRALR